MDSQIISTALSRYDFYADITHIDPYGYGRINKTWLVATPTEKYIFQRINSDLFRDVPRLMQNIQLVTDHLRAKFIGTSTKVLHIVPNTNGSLCTQVGSDFFRVYTYIDDSVCYQISPDTTTFHKVGSAFGSFQNALSDFDPQRLYTSIPNFHNTALRYRDFVSAVNLAPNSCALRHDSLVSAYTERQSYATIIQNLIDSHQIPTRVTHNDTKLNNIVFDKFTLEPLAILDLDTVMAGSLLHDFGDAIRSGCNTASEDEPDINKVHFDIDMFCAFTTGYLETMTDLTPTELQYLHISPLVLTYELGIRFLTDHLHHNQYFPVEYDGQNYHRAEVQMTLLREMEQNLTKMRDFIHQTYSKIHN